MNIIKNVKFKVLDKFIKKGFFGGRKYYFVLSIVDERLTTSSTQEQCVGINSYYRFEKGDTIGSDMYKHSDGLYRLYEEG